MWGGGGGEVERPQGLEGGRGVGRGRERKLHCRIKQSFLPWSRSADGGILRFNALMKVGPRMDG